MLLFLDIETTGLSHEIADIFELSAARFDGEKVIATFDELIRPSEEDFEIPPQIRRLCRITKDDLILKPQLKVIRTKFLQEFLHEDDIIVGHNISFDTEFLRAKGFEFSNKEIDTYPLSTILLPDEESYSLEILTQKYELPHEGAHRAMSDVLANIELWKLLSTKYVLGTSEPTREKDRALLQKTSWSGKIFFFEARMFFEEEKHLQMARISEKKSCFFPLQKTEKEEVFQKEVASVFEKGKKSIWEISPRFPSDPFFLATESAVSFSSKHHVPVGIVFSPRMKPRIRDLLSYFSEKFPHMSFVEFSLPEMKMCESRVQKFLEKPEYTDLEAIVGLKVLRNLERGESSLPLLKREEWSVSPEIRDTIHVDCSDSCPGKQFLPEKLVGKYDIFFIPQKLLREYHGKYILLEGAEYLEDILTLLSEIRVSSEETLSLSSLFSEDIREKIRFTFELLGGFLRKRAGENEYAVEIDVDAGIRKEKDWNEFFEVFSEILEEIDQSNAPSSLIKAITLWRDFFGENHRANELQFFRLLPENSIECYRNSISLDFAWEDFSKKHPCFLLFGEHFSKNVREEWVLPFSLPAEIEKKMIFLGEKPSPSLVRFSSSDGISSGDNTPKVAAEWLLQIIDAPVRNILAHFPSQKMLEQVEEYLLHALSQNDIACITPKSGSRGKIQAILQKPGRKILMGTSRFFDQVFPIEGISFDVFFYQKFQFDPPGMALLSKRKNLFSHSFEEYIVPRSVARFERELFRLFSSQKEPYVFFCFDPRIREKKGYGKFFEAALRENLEIEPICRNELKSFFS
ncbi:hypothetical protein HZA38_04120 [Candidatus Peregrinibacteria bacterium]|nr:hypothetical protein [Candidatus Peregrinibacteria bacterium]